MSWVTLLYCTWEQWQQKLKIPYLVKKFITYQKLQWNTSIYACCSSIGSSFKLAYQKLIEILSKTLSIKSFHSLFLIPYSIFKFYIFFSYQTTTYTSYPSTNKVTLRKSMVIHRYSKNDLFFTQFGTTFCNIGTSINLQILFAL